MTMSSLRISIDPREMKCNDVKTSPRCTSVSPGGACVVLNFIDNALHRKHILRCDLTVEYDKSLEGVPQAAGRRSLESWTVVEQMSVQMEAHIGLKSLRKALEDEVQVDAVRVRPRVLHTAPESESN